MLWLVLFLVVGLPVLVECINKIKRTDLTLATMRQLTVLEQVSSVLRAIGWFCLFLAAAGLAVIEGMPREYLKVGYALGVIASAALVARARIQEVLQDRTQPAGMRDGPDAYGRTQSVSADELRAAMRASMAIDLDVNRAAAERAQAINKAARQ